jgi:hypothetical protein
MAILMKCSPVRRMGVSGCMLLKLGVFCDHLFEMQCYAARVNYIGAVITPTPMASKPKPLTDRLYATTYHQLSEIAKQPAKVGSGPVDRVWLTGKGDKCPVTPTTGIQKPVLLTESMNPDPFGELTTRGDMLHFIACGSTNEFHTARPTTYVSENTINQCYDRHTLQSIVEVGRLEPATKDDQIALFTLAITYSQIEQEIRKAHGRKLACTHGDVAGHYETTFRRRTFWGFIAWIGLLLTPHVQPS